MSGYEQHVLEGAEFEAVRAAPLLAKKEVIGAGSFSVLFEGETEDSIYRLSTDSATHDFAWDARKSNLSGVVYPIENYGAVAIYAESAVGPDFLYLAHLERLHPLEKFPEQLASVSRLLAYLTDDEDGSLLATPEEKELVMSLLHEAPVEENTKSVIVAMQSLFPKYFRTADLDLSISNFMVRAETGEVVLSDPVHGLSSASDLRHERLLRDIHVFEVCK